MRHRVVITTLVLIAVCGAAGGQTPPMRGGYLAGREPNTLAVVPQAPAPGSSRDVADRAIFRETRRLEASPRWAMARQDAQLTIPDLLRDFSCAVGVNITEADAPALSAILRASVPDVVAAYGAPKDRYKRPRPFMRDEGDICVEKSKALSTSYDYPSGHATFAWAAGLILAELAPDRAGEVLRRARAFGESRAVCGVHSASAVTEARTAASTLVAALHGDAEFRAEMDRARSEMLVLRASRGAVKAQACVADAALAATTPW